MELLYLTLSSYLHIQATKGSLKLRKFVPGAAGRKQYTKFSLQNFGESAFRNRKFLNWQQLRSTATRKRGGQPVLGEGWLLSQCNAYPLDWLLRRVETGHAPILEREEPLESATINNVVSADG